MSKKFGAGCEQVSENRCIFNARIGWDLRQKRRLHRDFVAKCDIISFSDAEMRQRGSLMRRRSETLAQKYCAM
jgi:hypothetical protein